MSTETGGDKLKSATKSSRKNDDSHVQDVTVKSKKAKRRKVDAGEGKSEADIPSDVELKKHKKKHRHDDDEGTGDIEQVTEGIETAVVDERQKKKKRKRLNEATMKPNAEDESKERTAHDTSLENQELGNSKKKKREMEKTQDVEDGARKKKKRKTGSTGFPDPAEDAWLTDQARKALAYAYTQFDNPGSWKFNKARQNWLIRNIWSDQTIPELYMPLLTRYLTNIQGGVRETFMATCKSMLPQSSTTLADPSLLTTDSREVVADDTSPKELRARVLLDALA